MDGGAWWAAVHGVSESRTQLSDFTFTFHFPALEKEMATHSGVLAWRIPGVGEPGELLSMGSHRVGHDWSDLAAAAAASILTWELRKLRFGATKWFAQDLITRKQKCQKANPDLHLTPTPMIFLWHPFASLCRTLMCWLITCLLGNPQVTLFWRSCFSLCVPVGQVKTRSISFFQERKKANFFFLFY